MAAPHRPNIIPPIPKLFICVNLRQSAGKCLFPSFRVEKKQSVLPAD
jgi:hypothetical protein